MVLAPGFAAFGPGEQLVQGGFERFADFRLHPVDEKDSLQVIDLMLDGAGEEPAGGEAHFFSLKVEEIHLDPEAAADSAGQPWKTEAALVGVLTFAGEGEDGIAEKEGHVFFPVDRLSADFKGGRPFFDFAEVNDCDLQGNPDLGSGQTDPLGFIHGSFQGDG